MKPINPVKKTKKPAYPTRLEVLADPETLRENLPFGDQFKKEMAGAITIFLIANSTLKAAGNDTIIGPQQQAIVAPIFEHGEGRGATGCVVISPPVFLSEEEALQVIADELRSRGLDSPEKEKTLPGVEFSEDKPVVLDLFFPTEKVSIEYVSGDDWWKCSFENKKDCESNWQTTVQSYNLIDLAKQLVTRVAEDGKGIYLGAFYDPLIDKDYTSIDQDFEEFEKYQKDVEKIEKDSVSLSEEEKQDLISRRHDQYYNKVNQKQLAESKRLLRMQVLDFIKWLEGQGVI